MTSYARRRTPRSYNGTAITAHRLSDFLPSVLQQVHELHGERPDLILAAWPSVIGPQLGPMTRAVSFIDGVLLVTVKNSTLYSLLSQHEGSRLLRILRQQFPNTTIRHITFRIG